VNVKLKVGDLIRPKPNYVYTKIRTGICRPWVYEHCPPCVVVDLKKGFYPIFHCSWNNEVLMMTEPELDWCEVVNMRKEE